MEQQGISDVQVFHDRLEAEFTALSSLSQLPPEQTDKMDMYQKLVNLKARRYLLLLYFQLVNTMHTMLTWISGRLLILCLL
jgi:hypothetical protein